MLAEEGKLNTQKGSGDCLQRQECHLKEIQGNHEPETIIENELVSAQPKQIGQPAQWQQFPLQKEVCRHRFR